MSSLSSVFGAFNSSMGGSRDQLGQRLMQLKKSFAGRNQSDAGATMSAAAAGIQYLANFSSMTTKSAVTSSTATYDWIGLNSTDLDASAFNDTLNGTLADVDDFKLPYSYPEMVLIAIVAGFLSLLTVAGNCMVMISFKIDKQLQTISNYFLFSLAVADFAIGLISMPLYTLYILAGRWQLGPHVCDTWLSLDYLASNASVLNLLIISFDRYFSVTRPLTYRARRTPRRAGIMIAAAWVISLVLWPPWIYSWPYIEGIRKVPEDKCFIQFIETNNYITLGTAIAAFYGPVTVMCVLYWRVWRETENRQKDLVNLQAGKKNDSHRSNSSGEEQLVVTEVPLVDTSHHHHHHNAGGGGALADWRRSRSESSGVPEDIETTYVPAAVLTGSHRRRQGGPWTNLSNWRRWLRWSAWQHWIRSATRRRSGKSGEFGDDESYSDGSNVGTPASADTPLASSISRGTSANIIRDPYATTPVRYNSDARTANLERRRTLVASKSLTAENAKSETGTPLLRSHGGKSDTPEAGDSTGRLGNRSHSADSVFTIVIRLPRDSSVDSAEHATIRMIPLPNHGHNSTSGDHASGQMRAERSSRPTATQDRHHNPPALRSKSVPVGGVGHPLNRPRGLPQSSSTSTSSSLLCGTNLHLPNALSLSKLTSLTKPNHLPLKGKLKNTQASPWVPRSCMPVAQSPLLVRCTRFDGNASAPAASNNSNAAGVSGGGNTPTRPATGANSGANLPLDTKIIPKQLARSAGVGGVQTVSASVSAAAQGGFSGPGGAGGAVANTGTGPPARRVLPHIYQAQQAAAAAAAKKAAKKPKKKNVEKKQERKAAKTLSAILLAFILTWTPYNVLILLKALAPCDEDDCFPAELWNFCYYLCYINSTVNPVCYALCNASFRRTYVRILTCKWHSRTKTAVQRGFYN